MRRQTIRLAFARPDLRGRQEPLPDSLPADICWLPLRFGRFQWDLREYENVNRKIGFTLIELLVVIAVVGLLVALLLPAVQATRASARNLYCKSNMRQIGLGIHSYAESYRGKFPWTEHRDENESWIVSLGPFLEQVDMIRI